MFLIPKVLGMIASVIRQKGESQNGGYKKTKHAKFSEKLTLLALSYALTRVRFMG